MSSSHETLFSGVTIHLNFRGQALLAPDKQVFGDEQTLMTYGAMGQADLAEPSDHIIWGKFAAEGIVCGSWFDMQAGRNFGAGTSAFFVLLRDPSAADVRHR